MKNEQKNYQLTLGTDPDATTIYYVDEGIPAY